MPNRESAKRSGNVAKVDVLSIGAHAGDAEIASGIALAHEVNAGKRVAMCHLTLGEKGHPKMTSAEYAALKRKEIEGAAKVLGAKVYVLPYEDGLLPVSDEVKFAAADVIRDCQPDLIITHHSHSIHKDHVNCHLNVPDAVFYAGVAGFESDKPAHFCRKLYFAENWEDREGFVPEIVLEVTEQDMALWREMVSKYALFRGEVIGFPYVEYYEKLARLRGIENYAQYAVAFGRPESARRQRVTDIV
jgi:N-acetylglucosamine malate deacetylase 1